MTQPLQVDYYTDVLCVWAWIAQRRIDEIAENWAEQINLQCHYVDVFGDAVSHIGKKWSDRGGCAGSEDAESDYQRQLCRKIHSHHPVLRP